MGEWKVSGSVGWFNYYSVDLVFLTRFFDWFSFLIEKSSSKSKKNTDPMNFLLVSKILFFLKMSTHREVLVFVIFFNFFFECSDCSVVNRRKFPTCTRLCSVKMHSLAKRY